MKRLFVLLLYSTGAYSLSPGASFGPAAPTWTYVASPPESFNAQNIGGAQRLPNGNTLVCDGRHGTFFEVASDGATVWTYVNPVVASGPLTQGDSIPSGSSGQENTVFRVYRYGPDYLGLAGRDLTPRGTIEIQPPADVEPQATGNRGSARLDAVAPNPIAGVMRVRFTLPSRGWVRLTLRDVQGRRVRAIFEGESSAGRHEVAEDLQGLAAGVYLVAMEWPGGQSARRVVRVR